jgi:hypothetical protein
VQHRRCSLMSRVGRARDDRSPRDRFRLILYANCRPNGSPTASEQNPLRSFETSCGMPPVATQKYRNAKSSIERTTNDARYEHIRQTCKRDLFKYSSGIASTPKTARARNLNDASRAGGLMRSALPVHLAPARNERRCTHTQVSTACDVDSHDGYRCIGYSKTSVRTTPMDSDLTSNGRRRSAQITIWSAIIPALLRHCARKPDRTIMLSISEDARRTIEISRSEQ